MDKKEYIAYLRNLILENEELNYTKPTESIYVIDDLWIGGGYFNGIRSIDHWVLLNKELIDYGLTWQHILSWGIIIVPETNSYISDVTYTLLEDMYHFIRYPTNNNYIVGQNVEIEL